MLEQAVQHKWIGRRTRIFVEAEVFPYLDRMCCLHETGEEMTIHPWPMTPKEKRACSFSGTEAKACSLRLSS